MKGKTVKETLEKAGRYQDVMDILKSIYTDQSLRTSSYGIYTPYVDPLGKTHWNVDGREVIFEALDLSEAIASDDKAFDDNDNPLQFEQLYDYVQSTHNMLMHNYANNLLHRIKPRVDIDKIRAWGVLYCVLEKRSDELLDIPDGWRRLPEDKKPEKGGK
jgi:hypothetical protein